MRTANIPGLPVHATGKVRDIYDLGETLLIVASDRVSAFDCVMPTAIPDKGRVLTLVSRHWFRELRPVCPTHYITIDPSYIRRKLVAAGMPPGAQIEQVLDSRAMLVTRSQILPVECVVRGYISGSLWSAYVRAGGPERGAVINGIEFPSGLRESDRLPAPIFTPSTKATSGHDENISMDQLTDIVGETMAETLARVSLELYQRAVASAAQHGIIIADTKFEFGQTRGTLTLCDEALTPDSSRFWDAALYAPGRPQPSFDKQYLRDWLTASGWNKEPPAPELPADVVEQTRRRYVEAHDRITGEQLLS